MSETAPMLAARHLAMLCDESGISPAVIAARGYRTVTTKAELAALGFAEYQQRAPGLLLPVWTPDGGNTLAVYRPDTPRQRSNGKAAKYEWLEGAPLRVDCPPSCQPMLADTSAALWITEGMKKADCLASWELCAIALQGVWGWAGEAARADLQQIALDGRQVRIVFDSDLRANGNVRKAEHRLTEHLQSRGAQVGLVRLPNEGGRIGVDDYLAAGHTVAELEGLVTEAPTNTERDRLLLKHGGEDEGNAQTVATLHRGRFLWCEVYGWLAWTGSHWEREGAEATLDRAIVDTLKERRAAAVRAEIEGIVKSAKASAYRVRGAKYLLASLVPALVGDFDALPHRLNCANGVVDLRTGELTPHDPSQRYTYCTPTAYDASADQSQWRAFLCSSVGDDPDLLAYVQQAAGYSITGRTNEECLFYVEGPARAGKGTFIETVIAALGGRPLADTVEFGTFTGDRRADSGNFDLAGLKPCRLIAASETRACQELNAAKVKHLTGGDQVRCSHKYGPYFTYRPTFKVWLLANTPINANVDDEALWSRVHVLRFPHSFVGHEDKGLKARLRQPENLVGVMAWLVQGAMAWYASGPRGLQRPALVREATDAARFELDDVGQWLRDCTAEQPGAFTLGSLLHASYTTWCSDNGFTPKGQRAFMGTLRRKGYTTGEQRKMEGRNLRGTLGLKLL